MEFPEGTGTGKSQSLCFTFMRLPFRKAQANCWVTLNTADATGKSDFTMILKHLLCKSSVQLEIQV